MLATWGYAALAGFEPSVQRAAIMASLVLLAVVAGRWVFLPLSLALSAVIMTLWDPFLFWDLGFQLSVLSLTGMLAMSTLLIQLTERLRPSDGYAMPLRIVGLFVGLPFAATLGASLATLPVQAINFGLVPLGSVAHHTPCFARITWHTPGRDDQCAGWACCAGRCGACGAANVVFGQLYAAGGATGGSSAWRCRGNPANPSCLGHSISSCAQRRTVGCPSLAAAEYQLRIALRCRVLASGYCSGGGLLPGPRRSPGRWQRCCCCTPACCGAAIHDEVRITFLDVGQG